MTTSDDITTLGTPSLIPSLSPEDLRIPEDAARKGHVLTAQLLDDWSKYTKEDEAQMLSDNYKRLLAIAADTAAFTA